jgi:hypothetical protein
MHSHADTFSASRGLQPARTSARPEGRGSSCVRGDLVMAEGYEALLGANGLDSLDALFAHSSGERLDKPGLDPWRERLRLTLRDGERGQTFFLKRFLHPPRDARRAVQRSGSGARSLAGNEWAWIQRLTADGVPCVEAVAYGEEVRKGREVRSAGLTAEAAGRSLEKWVREWGEADRPIVRRLVPATASLISRLHGRGYIHRDLYLSHLFYDPSQPVDRSLRLIDLQRVIRPRWRFRRWMVKDIASLNFSTPPGLVSRSDRLRWLRRYLDIEKLDASARRLVYRIVGKTQRIAERERAKSHP